MDSNGVAASIGAADGKPWTGINLPLARRVS